ncbi:MAG: T9SS type A sorting domain-containing protein [Bacteroidia bacterium]|nr:T9SS type A sorting domain-containing protein [Bacteroidia bacterium]
MKKFIYLIFIFIISSSAYAQIPLFGNEIHVKINGLTFDAMEPALSTDGNALFFNSLNNGTTTSLFYASKVNDSTFNYIGAVPVVNQTVTPRLDAVASLDSVNNFYWVSTRNYPSNFDNLHRIRFLTSGYTNFGRVHGDFYIYSPGWLIMDAGINFYGNKLIYCNAFFNNCANAVPCIASMGIATKLNDSTFNKDANTTTIMANINDTVNYIVYAPALTKDGLELYYTRLLKNSTQTEIMVSTRTNTNSAFGLPTLLVGAPYIVPEAPTISTDKTKMYYHRKNGNLFEIYLKYRTGTTDIKEITKEPVISLYPNPTNGNFTINSAEDIHVMIYNSVGDLVLKTNSSTIDLKDHPCGIYFVTINTTTSSKTIKLIKQNNN